MSKQCIEGHVWEEGELCNRCNNPAITEAPVTPIEAAPVTPEPTPEVAPETTPAPAPEVAPEAPVASPEVAG